MDELKNNWRDCKIVLCCPPDNEEWYLKDTFSECLGNIFEGVAFITKGIPGENARVLILKVESNGDCYWSDANDNWILIGKLIKLND